MKGLKCSTENCVYNHNCHCNAGIVRLNKKAACKTKEKSELGTLSTSESGKFPSKFSYIDNTDVLVQCDSTNCKFNKDKYCFNDKINLCDTFFNTKCFSKFVNV